MLKSQQNTLYFMSGRKVTHEKAMRGRMCQSSDGSVLPIAAHFMARFANNNRYNFYTFDKYTLQLILSCERIWQPTRHQLATQGVSDKAILLEIN